MFIGPVEVTLISNQDPMINTNNWGNNDVSLHGGIPNIPMTLSLPEPLQSSSTTTLLEGGVDTQNVVGRERDDHEIGEVARIGISRKGRPKLFIGQHSYVQTKIKSSVEATQIKSWRCYKMHCRGRVYRMKNRYIMRNPHSCNKDNLN